MLSLTRRVGEEIVIGDPRNPLGTIRVVDVHGDKVRLSFDFPREVAVNRKELADQKREQLEGGQGKPGDKPGDGKPPEVKPPEVKPPTP